MQAHAEACDWVEVSWGLPPQPPSAGVMETDNTPPGGAVVRRSFRNNFPPNNTLPRIFPMAGTERRREISRLRARRKKTINLLQRVKAGTMEKEEAARKLRRLTPGADVIIKREGLA